VTWNVRSLLKSEKLANVINEMNRLHIDILGMSEVKWKGNSMFSTLHDYKVYYSGDDINHQYGVGVIVNRQKANYVTNVVPQSHRIMLIQLQSAPFKLNIIQVYAPTLDRADEEVEDFYNK
jgi:hypothetical protein